MKQFLKEIQINNTLSDLVYRSSKLISLRYPSQSLEADIIKIEDLHVYLTPLCGSSSILDVASKLGIKKGINSLPETLEHKALILSRSTVDRVVSFYNKKIYNCNTIAKCLSLGHLTPFKPRMEFQDFIRILNKYPVNQLKAEKHLRSIYAIRNNLKGYFDEIEICEVDSLSGQARLAELGLSAGKTLRSSNSLSKGVFIKGSDLSDSVKLEIENIYSADQGV